MLASSNKLDILYLDIISSDSDSDQRQQTTLAIRVLSMADLGPAHWFVFDSKLWLQAGGERLEYITESQRSNLESDITFHPGLVAQRPVLTSRMRNAVRRKRPRSSILHSSVKIDYEAMPSPQLWAPLEYQPQLPRRRTAPASKPPQHRNYVDCTGRLNLQA